MKRLVIFVSILMCVLMLGGVFYLQRTKSVTVKITNNGSKILKEVTVKTYDDKHVIQQIKPHERVKVVLRSIHESGIEISFISPMNGETKTYEPDAEVGGFVYGQVFVNIDGMLTLTSTNQLRVIPTWVLWLKHLNLWK